MLRAAPLLLALLAAPAHAACYADYKASRADPLRLHYGVIELPDAACDDPEAAAAEVARRLEAGGDGWGLLEVMGVFAEDGLEERRTSADAYFLRY